MEFDEEDQEQNNTQNKVYNVREMTALEKQYFEKAKIKQRQNLIKPQIVHGKMFKGQAFISKPEKIIFKDFTAGESMTQTVYLTNVSFGQNSFKLLPLNDAIKDDFDILYTPSGRISAGISVPIQIRFNPQLNKDIDDVFPILAETGQINIQLICTCKKAIVKTGSNVIDFGKVIYGEESTQQLNLINHGALETDIVIKDSKGQDFTLKGDSSSYQSSINFNVKSSYKDNYSEKEEQNQDSQLEDFRGILSQLKFDKNFKIKGYDSLNIPFTYKPDKIGQFELHLICYFENFLHSPSIDIILKGECVEVPIYIEKPVYDFQICLLNHIYREKLVFYNRSPNAMKIQIMAPKETKNFFEFNPILGYIQGLSKFEIWVKMNLDKEIMNVCSKYLNDDILQIPFKLVGADQKMPVLFQIKCNLTINTFNISPSKLDFGRIFKQTASRLAITFDNFSQLPQEFIFYPLPQEFSIEPSLVPLKLLPKEKITIAVIYHGKEIKKEDSFLNLRVITGTYSTRDIRIPYICEVVKSPLQFSALKIDMPVLQIDENFNTNIQVKNTSDQPIIYELFLPEYELSGLKATPCVQTLNPQTEKDINIEYFSFFKKLTPYTLYDLKQKYENDPIKNFELRLKQMDGGAKEQVQQQQQSQKQPEKKAPAKDDKKGLSQKQLKELELEQQRQAELDRLKEEEELQKKAEMEKNFDLKKELIKLGGKFYEFNEPESTEYNQHYVWLIPCYFKILNQPDKNKEVIYLEISTASIQKSLVFDKNIIDFGEVAVGQKKTHELLITNKSISDAALKMDLMPLFGGFTVINALRTLKPGQTKGIIVQFDPNEKQVFKQKLRIYSDKTCVTAYLKGEGIRPQVQIEPEDGLMNMGSVLLGEYIEKSLKIQNISNFSIHFSLNTLVNGLANHNNSEVFQFIPQEGQIEANQKLEIKIVFKPDRISDKFYKLITVNVPNQVEEKRLFLYGACFNRQTYIKEYKPYLKLPQVNDFPAHVEYTFDILKSNDEENIYSNLNNKIVLEFKKPLDKNDQDEKCFSRKLVIGNSKLLDPKMEKNGNYEIIMPKENQYFVCDSLKGAIQSGQIQNINFTFKPPKIDTFIAGIEALEGIGSWIEQKGELKLNGGFIKPGTVDNWNFEIILRAYINQI